MAIVHTIIPSKTMLDKTLSAHSVKCFRNSIDSLTQYREALALAFMEGQKEMMIATIKASPDSDIAKALQNMLAAKDKEINDLIS